jgi:hypothetical protein
VHARELESTQSASTTINASKESSQHAYQASTVLLAVVRSINVIVTSSLSIIMAQAVENKLLQRPLYGANSPTFDSAGPAR